MFTSFERFVKVYSLVNFSFFFVNFFHLFPMKDIYHFDAPFMPCSRLFWSDLNLSFGKPSSFPSEQTQKKKKKHLKLKQVFIDELRIVQQKQQQQTELPCKI